MMLKNKKHQNVKVSENAPKISHLLVPPPRTASHINVLMCGSSFAGRSAAVAWLASLAPLPCFLFIPPSLIALRAPNLCAELQTTQYGSVSGWVRICGGSSPSHTILSDDPVRVSPPAAHHQPQHERSGDSSFYVALYVVRDLNHQWLT